MCIHETEQIKISFYRNKLDRECFNFFKFITFHVYMTNIISNVKELDAITF